MPKNNPENPMRLEIDPNVAKGDYSNFVKIQHTAIDFRFDFARVFPDENLMFVNSRIFMSPLHAKMFCSALKDNLDKYEKSFGVIDVRPDKSIQMPVVTGSKETH
jgi:hypothetical protein